MYEQHFGFERPLFPSAMAQDEAIFRTPAIEQLVRDLAIALIRRDSVAVICGASGTGKTTVASDSLKNIDTQLAYASLGQPPLTQDELLEQLLTDFGFEPNDKSRVERLQLWRQFLSEMGATNTRVAILIENSENWSPDVLQGLHSLTAADTDLSPGANLVLTSGAPAGGPAALPESLALNQRVRLRRRIDPLTAADTSDYLEFKCRHSNVSAERIFSGDFAAQLHEYSGGIIKVIDNLLESSLIQAAADDKSAVDVGTLTQVAVNQFGMQALPADRVVEDLLLQPPPQAAPDVSLTTATPVTTAMTDVAAEPTDNIPVLTDIVVLPKNAGYPQLVGSNP